MTNNKKKAIKAKIKKELGYMKKGAKVLPSVVVRKGKAWVKTQIEEARERAKVEKQIEAAAKAAEREAYKVEAIKQAKIRGAKRATKVKAGWRGALQEVGAIGESLSLGGILGVETGKKQEKVVRKSELDGLAGMDSSSYLFSGLGKKPKKKKS